MRNTYAKDLTKLRAAIDAEIARYWAKVGAPTEAEVRAADKKADAALDALREEDKLRLVRLISAVDNLAYEGENPDRNEEEWLPFGFGEADDAATEEGDDDPERTPTVEQVSQAIAEGEALRRKLARETHGKPQPGPGRRYLADRGGE